MRPYLRIALALFAALAVAGCPSAPATNTESCTGDDACPPGKRCSGGQCQAVEGADAQVPPGGDGKTDAGTSTGGDAGVLADAGVPPCAGRRDCTEQGIGCGPAGDGCGGVLDCGECPPPQTCGGGGVLGQCGGTHGCVRLDASTACARLNLNCGQTSDGCGELVECGTCVAPQTCGGGGVPGRCGGVACTKKTCAQLGVTCGAAGDGCGGTLSCGSCPTGTTCGGGGTPGVCGTTCVPKTCAQLGISCGPAGDGCGGVLNCGSCSGGETCGGAGVPGVCGKAPCTPKTCAQLGLSCGPAGDGCGGLLQCGSCSAPEICGGGGVPGVCGSSVTCTNLCQKQVTCPAGTTTSVRGTVFAPGRAPAVHGDPLYNVLVYIPNGTVSAFPAGVSCDQCAASVSGSPLVSAYSGKDGTFTLNNAPVGTDIPLVIQSGRWRRQVKINVTACQDNPVDASLTRLPRNQSEGDIPRIAVATGSVDSTECVLRKIGIDDSEFTKPTGTGRIHLYVGQGDAGANAGTGTPNESTLWGTLATLKKYDMVLFPCQGAEYLSRLTTSGKQNVVDYANAGGRVYATHFSYVWLYNVNPFSTTANWNPKGTSPADQDGILNTGFPKGESLAQWLLNVDAATTFGRIPVKVLRNDVQGTRLQSQSWMTVPNPTSGEPDVTLHYTFNTPVGASPDQQCGRVLFDDFHVEDASNNQTTGKVFPAECDDLPMTAQEKLLEFMLFDLGSCITPDAPTCTPKTCAEQNFNCGPQGDGCGGQLACGVCPAGQTCGGSGLPGICGAPTCVPKSCAELNIGCGPAGDGCGGQLNCGSCPAGQSCGGGGLPGVCGSSCVPKTCAELGFNCGFAGDGCGGQLDCGSCNAPEVCGANNKPNVCGRAPCTPTTCAQLGFNCGPAGDGCGGLLDCGTCTSPQVCGADGVVGVCGTPPCTPRTCQQMGYECGAASDGCGGLLDCGTCEAPFVCGALGLPNRCRSRVN